jgi:hypothetical protein
MKMKTLAQARKDLNDYIKLAKKEQVMWRKRVKAHEKEILRLCEVYIKIQDKEGK